VRHFNLISILLTLVNTSDGQKLFTRNVCTSLEHEKIIFESNRDGHPPTIYMADKSGDNVQKLVNNNAINGSPQWSPDGKSILYYSNEGNSNQGNLDLFILDVENMNTKKITSGWPKSVL